MSAEDKPAESPNPSKFKSRPEFSNLTRCASCYSQQKHARHYYGDGESSSSAEDSGPEVDCESESESESSSSSCCSERDLVEVVEEPETEKLIHEEVCGDAAEPESGGKDGDGQEETPENQETDCRITGVTQRGSVVRASSLLDPMNTHLMPMRLLPRPDTVVSTLSLQVLSHDDKATYVAKEHQKNSHKSSGEEFRFNSPLPPQMGLLGQQPLSQPYQLPHQDQLQQYQLPHQDQLQQYQLPHQDQLQQYQLPHQDQLQQHQLTHQDQLQQHQLIHQDQLQKHQLTHQDQLKQQPHQDQLQQQQLSHHLQQLQLSHQHHQQQHHHLHLLQQQQPSQRHQLQQPQLFPPLYDNGQRLPAPLQTLSGLQPMTFHAPFPVPNAPQSHLHTPASQPYWYSETVQMTHSPFGHYSSGQLPSQ